jgi:hypothetical protein
MLLGIRRRTTRDVNEVQIGGLGGVVGGWDGTEGTKRRQDKRVQGREEEQRC